MSEIFGGPEEVDVGPSDEEEEESEEGEGAEGEKEGEPEGLGLEAVQYAAFHCGESGK